MIFVEGGYPDNSYKLYHYQPVMVMAALRFTKLLKKFVHPVISMTGPSGGKLITL